MGLCVLGPWWYMVVAKPWTGNWHKKFKGKKKTKKPKIGTDSFIFGKYLKNWDGGSPLPGPEYDLTRTGGYGYGLDQCWPVIINLPVGYWFF
jgi:hypothetical protein